MSNFKAGVYRQRDQYSSFEPNKINVPYKWGDTRIDLLLEEARGSLGELNAYSKLIPNVDFFIHMHTKKEATASSRIEGTKTEIDEAVLPEDEIAPERKNDWNEIQNYTKAMNKGIENMNKIPLSMRLLKEVHAILLSDVRGNGKMPGEIRTSQNWIGGSSLKDAFFIPPHHLGVPELLGDLELFWHNDKLEIPHLIKNAISHYQFETIHPFLDGNGRIGRMSITLLLIKDGLLNKPTLYPSDFFERNKGAYYDALTLARSSNNIEHWIRFFLSGIAETAKKSAATMDKIIDLSKKCDSKIITLRGRAKNGETLLKILYDHPVTNSGMVARDLGVTAPTANKLIVDFQKFGILKELTGFSRNRLFLFNDYFNLFKY